QTKLQQLKLQQSLSVSQADPTSAQGTQTLPAPQNPLPPPLGVQGEVGWRGKQISLKQRKHWGSAWGRPRAFGQLLLSPQHSAQPASDVEQQMRPAPQPSGVPD